MAAFFFQAEDGIRDKLVTGVQTCALPISPAQALQRAQALAPDGATARRLAMAQAAAAPALAPQMSGSHDSDGNTTLRVGGAAELAASGPLRLGVAAGREQVGGRVPTTGLPDAALRAA